MFGLSARQIFLLLLLVAALFVGSQVIPAYFNAFQFNDSIKQEVKFAAASRRTTELVRTRIVEKAKEYDIALAPRDIHITRRGPTFNLEFDYVIPINLRVYQRNLNFHVSESGEIFDQ
jgi:hypothetical protein